MIDQYERFDFDYKRIVCVGSAWLIYVELAECWVKSKVGWRDQAKANAIFSTVDKQ